VAVLRCQWSTLGRRPDEGRGIASVCPPAGPSQGLSTEQRTIGSAAGGLRRPPEPTSAGIKRGAGFAK